MRRTRSAGCARAMSGHAVSRPAEKYDELAPPHSSPPRLRTGYRSGSNLHGESPNPCPLWVISGHLQRN